MRSLVLFVVLFILFHPRIDSQYSSIVFDRLSESEGFKGGLNRSIIQDHLGFIWIGSVGIYRYDGYKFMHHLALPGCKNCPPTANYYIKGIVEDDLGLLWMLTINGIALYDPEKERTMLLASTSVLHDSYNFYNSKINDIIKDSRGDIWASDEKGLARISFKGKGKVPASTDLVFNSDPDSIYQVEYLSVLPGIQSERNEVNSIYEDKWGDIWVGTRDGLYILRNGNGPFIRVDEGIDRNTRLAGKRVFDILQINDDSFWIATSSGLSRITNVKNSLFGKDTVDISLMNFSAHMKDEGMVRSLLMDRNNNLLIGSGTGLYLMHQASGSDNFFFKRVYPNVQELNSYGDNNGVRAIMQDKTGEIWIVHDYGGIIRLNLGRSIITSFTDIFKDDLSSIEISSLHEDINKNIWAGTFRNGLYRISSSGSRVEKYNSGSLKDPVFCIYEYKPGSLLLGMERGVIEFNILTGQFKNPFAFINSRPADNLQRTRVSHFLKDGENLYISSRWGIFVYNYQTGKLFQATLNNNYSVPDTKNQFQSILKSVDGEILAASSDKGICRVEYNKNTDILTLIPVTCNNASVFNILDCPNIALHQSTDGSLWLGNGHLQKIDLKTGEIRTYKLVNDIDFVGILSILEDNHGNLWLGTGHGLCRFNIKSEKIKFFDRGDGLPFTRHNDLAAFKTADGLMYFGGKGGFYSIHPDSIKINKNVPPVVFTDFRLSNRTVNVDSSKRAILKRKISYTQSISLPHNQNDFSVEFSALDYFHPMRNMYSYKLEGYQDDWIETDAQNRVASYTNLDPGSYIFRVKGSNSDGVWNENGSNLTIRILSPWWATSFARAIYLLLFVFSVTAYIRWRIWHLKKEKTELEAIVTVRTGQVEKQKEEILVQKTLLEEQNQKITELDQIKNRFFNNISHEFRTPLSLIQGPVEELLDNPRRNKKELWKLNIVYRNARRLLDLVNQLLDISKIDNSKMKLVLIESDVMRFLRAITASFNSLAETREIDYKCWFPSDQKNTWFDPDKCEKIVNNLLANAFKFTPGGGEINFRANYEYHKDSGSLSLYLSISDNGPGIPEGSLEKIFDRFYQMEKSVRTECGGAGLGLSLALDMARLMHGDIQVTSQPGKGSTFSVQVPLGKEHLDENEFTITDQLPESVYVRPFPGDEINSLTFGEDLTSTKKPVILIVEDNTDIRIQLADNLQQKYIIRHASDGIVGLKKATEIIPDLIITDLMMPFMDGYEMCKRIKKDERTCHIPIIMLTAKITVEDKINGLKIGADDYIPKPFHIAELKARVDNLIDQRRKLRERFSHEITIQLSDIAVTPLDERFLKRAISLVEQHLNDDHFNLPRFREGMNMSSSTLFRKLHALTNQSPSEFIRTLRLKRAASLLSQNFGNVTQVSLEVGFNNLSYFNKSFRKLYGISPSEYVKTHKKE